MEVPQTETLDERLVDVVPEEITKNVMPRRLERFKAAPKGHKDYVAGDELDVVIGIKKNLRPTERKKEGWWPNIRINLVV